MYIDEWRDNKILLHAIVVLNPFAILDSFVPFVSDAILIFFVLYCTVTFQKYLTHEIEL